MDTRNKLKTAIIEWQESKLPILQKRDYLTNIDAPHINDIVGVRRCGKTFYMYQLISELINKGLPKSSILYLNLDDERLHPLNGDELALLIEVFKEIYEIREDERLYLFLDEIQNFQGWEYWLKGIYDRRSDIKVIISGSNASLLSCDISYRLTGRHLTTRMLPFSFNEFLKSKKISYNIETLQFSEKKIEIKRNLNEYSIKGGFPESIFYPMIDHRELLQSYFDDIIYRDIISRYNIRNPVVFKELALFCISNISKPHTYNSLKKLFSKHTSISTDIIINYISYLNNAFLLFTVNHYDASLKKQINKPKKIYCVDTGIINAVSFRFSEDYGRIYENLVFTQLLRNNENIYYWQDKKGLEVDFVTKRGLNPEKLIQVCVDLSDPKTKEREVNGLLSAMDYFGIEKGIIITTDLFLQETVNGKRIDYLPLWYWLLLTENGNFQRAKCIGGS